MSNTSASQTGLRRVDAGWLYLLAGAALVSSMVLIGPADDLVQLQYRRDRLAALEDDAIAKLQAYETFLEAIDDADPMLVRRLAAAQLNLVPENAKPIGVVGTELDAHVDDWITETLPPPEEVAPPKVKDSWLRRLSSGPTRLWAILAGVVLIFIGLLPQAEVAPEAVDDLEGFNDEADELPTEQGDYEDDMVWEGEFCEEDDEFVDEDDAEKDEDEDEEADEEVEDFEDADLVQPATAHRPIVTESGELLDADDVDGDEDEPLVQVVTISASTAP